MSKFRIMILLFLLLFFFVGCSYLKNRAGDAGDIIDLGFTFSSKPQFALYYDFIPIIPIGYGEVDGKFIGLGGGKFGWWTSHYERSYGLILWGQEEVTFEKSKSDLNKMKEDERNKELNFQRTGLIGIFQGPFPSTDYLISCPHYIHLGWFGVVASPRYLQILDFVFGWTTLDIGSDDNAGEKKEEKDKTS